MFSDLPVIDIVVFLGISQGLFLAITLQFISNTNHRANNVLSCILVLAMIMLIGRYFYSKYLTYFIFQWSFIVDSIVFLFGPLIFLYIKRFLFKNNVNQRLTAKDFIPFFILLISAICSVIYFTPIGFSDFVVEKKLIWTFNVIIALMLLHNIIYILKAFKLIWIFKKEKTRTLSFEQASFGYLNSFLIAYATVIVLWGISFINSVVLNINLDYINYDSIWVAIPIFIYVIGYFSLKQPELFRVSLKPSEKIKKERLSPSETSILKDKLDSLMLNEAIYLQPNLTLYDVSEKLNTTTNNVSWLLNNVYQSTFYDFINEYRVKEFIKKVENNEHLSHTILALSMDVGFNSKSTFNKAFKLTMKDTPSSYIKKHQAA